MVFLGAHRLNPHLNALVNLASEKRHLSLATAQTCTCCRQSPRLVAWYTGRHHDQHEGFLSTLGRRYLKSNTT